MRYPGLDLLRALAIVWVMLFHSYQVGGLGPWGDALARHGWVGVDLFFVLSGFLVGQQVLAPIARGERLRIGDFYLRRALRILPAYWLVLALYLLWPGFRERPDMEPWWKFVFFLFNLTHTLQRDAFAQAWSLCVEEHFYLVLPLLAAALAGRIDRRGFVALCVFLVSAGVILRGAIWLHEARAQVAAGVDAVTWYGRALYYPTWNRLDGLLAGLCLAMLRVFRPDQWVRWQQRANLMLTLGLVLLGLAIASFWSRISPVGNTVGWPLLSAAMALLVFAAASRHSWIGARALPVVGWLAAVSYSLYLTHTAVAALVHRHLGHWLDGHGVLTFTGYALAVLAAGAVLHYAVERPGLRLRERWLSRHRPPVGAAPTASGPPAVSGRD